MSIAFAINNQQFCLFVVVVPLSLNRCVLTGLRTFAQSRPENGALRCCFVFCFVCFNLHKNLGKCFGKCMVLNSAKEKIHTIYLHWIFLLNLILTSNEKHATSYCGL